MMRSEQLLAVARQLGHDTLDELMAAVGFGHLPTAEVIAKLVTPSPGTAVPVAEPVSTPKTPVGKSDDKGVQVKGARDLLMQLPAAVIRCRGIGFSATLPAGRGLTIHSVDCPNLEALDYDRERLVEVEWDTATPGLHAVKVSVMAVDKTGVLANVSSAISECQANISRAEIATREDRKAMLDFMVEVNDTSTSIRC